eukprot:7365618-Pyramimonas_sp.AAC.1
MIDCADWGCMSPPYRLEHFKYLMKEAAREARDNDFRRRPHHPATLLQLARSMARVVWRQD